MHVGNAFFTIIGVTPPDFYGDTLEPDPPGLYLPLSADRQLNRERALIDQPGVHWLYLLGRLSPNTSASQAQLRLTPTLRNWLLTNQGSAVSAERLGRISRSHVELTPGGSGIVHMQRDYSLTLRLLLGISMAVLLITCANIPTSYLPGAPLERLKHSCGSPCVPAAGVSFGSPSPRVSHWRSPVARSEYLLPQPEQNY